MITLEEKFQELHQEWETKGKQLEVLGDVLIVVKARISALCHEQEKLRIAAEAIVVEMTSQGKV